jgi:hypothetical protein
VGYPVVVVDERQKLITGFGEAPFSSVAYTQARLADKA